jgi:hypothetical protein
LPGADVFGLKLQAFLKATIFLGHSSEVQGVESFCCGSHIQRQTASPQRIKFPDENSTVLRKRLAANVLALRAKAGTAVAYSFFPSFRNSMQAPHFRGKAMDFLPNSGTFITPR